MKLQVILTLIIVFFLSACSGLRINVGVDSICAFDDSARDLLKELNVKKEYILTSEIKDVDQTDLQFKEYARYGERVLAAEGYVRTDDARSADLAIGLFDGISNPREHQSTVPFPVYGQTGISSSRTSGTVNTYGNYGTYSGTTTYTPSYGITGFVPITTTHVSYTHTIVLEAYDFNEYAKTKKWNSLWKITASSVNSCGDLRIAFPMLVAALKPYINVNTGKKISIWINENDKKVKEVKGTANQKK